MSSLLNGRYEIHERLGEGGMAVVFRATQVNLDREVAIKFIKASASITGGTLATRFQREAKAIAQLNHPNITQVYDFDVSEDGLYYLVMERLQGMDLAQFLTTYGPLPLADTIAIMEGVAAALDYAHQRQIIHRDVKPSNIFITTQKQIKLMDFGLAKLASDTNLTNSGSAIGTPKYFAPEQANGKSVDHRSDIYSLGVVFFQLLTGQLPYDSDSIVNLIVQHLTAPIPDPLNSNPQLPPITTQMILKMMAKEPVNRYANIAEFLVDLRAVTSNEDSSGVLYQVDLNITPLEKSSSDTPFATVVFSQNESAPQPNHTLLQHSIRLPMFVVMLLALSLLTGVVVGFSLLTTDGDEVAEKNETRFVADIAPAQTGEYLILVADWGDADQTLRRRVADAIRISDPVVTSPHITVRTEEINHQIQNTAEALDIANTVGAHLMVWGVEDEVGVEIIFEDVYSEPRSASTLRFVIPKNQSYNDIVAVDMPIALRFYLGSMLLHHFVRTSDIDGIAGYGISPTTNVELRVIPVSDLDRHILDTFYREDFDDLESLIMSLTNALRLVPGDPTLLFLRSYYEGFYRNDLAQAQADIDRLFDLIGKTNFSLWAQMNIDLAQEDYQDILTLSDQLDTSIPGYGLPFSYRQLALAMTGNFEQLQREIQGDITEQAVFGLPIWDVALALSYAVQGDEAKLSEATTRVVTNRELEASASFISNIDTPPAPFFIVGGYLSELNDQTLLAVLAYEQGLMISPENYILNWRRGTTAEQQNMPNGAYLYYENARLYAPVPFPIATYRQAVLIYKFPDQVPSNTPSACDQLGIAETEANTDPTFYQPLLDQIREIKLEWGCI